MTEYMPRDVYLLVTQLRNTFEQILSTLQEDEARLRVGYSMLQKERDAMGKEIYDWHQRRPSFFPISPEHPPAQAAYPADDATPNSAGEDVEKREGLNADVKTGVSSASHQCAVCDTFGAGSSTLDRNPSSPARDKYGASAHIYSPSRETDISRTAPVAVADPRGTSCKSFLRHKPKSPSRGAGYFSCDPSTLSSSTAVKKETSVPSPLRSKSPRRLEDVRQSTNFYTAAASNISSAPSVGAATTSTLHPQRATRKTLFPVGPDDNDAVRSTPSSTNLSMRNDDGAVGNESPAYLAAATGRWVYIWPCFGRFRDRAISPARAYIFPHYRYMEDLTEKASRQLDCQPAPSYLYEPDGRVVRDLAALKANRHYLLFPSGGHYTPDAVPSALLDTLVREARKTVSVTAND